MVFKQRVSAIFFVYFLFLGFSSWGQNQEVTDESKGVQINSGVDLVSRYIWRGTDFGDSPSIQPALSVSAGHFEFGGWGAVSTTHSYKEFDLYAKASFSDFFVVLTDYYIPTLNGLPASPDNRYFVYGDTSTCHTLEASLGYKSSGKYPFWLQANLFFYGNDKHWGYDAAKDSASESYYSSYIEAGYSFSYRNTGADVFAGFTPVAGAYGNKAGIVNIGLTVSKNLQITESFDLPLKTSLIFNPQTSSVWFVVGITLTQ